MTRTHIKLEAHVYSKLMLGNTLNIPILEMSCKPSLIQINLFPWKRGYFHILRYLSPFMNIQDIMQANVCYFPYAEDYTKRDSSVLLIQCSVDNRSNTLRRDFPKCTHSSFGEKKNKLIPLICIVNINSYNYPVFTNSNKYFSAYDLNLIPTLTKN